MSRQIIDSVSLAHCRSKAEDTASLGILELMVVKGELGKGRRLSKGRISVVCSCAVSVNTWRQLYPQRFCIIFRQRKKKKEQKTLSHKQQHELKSHMLRVAEISC